VHNKVILSQRRFVASSKLTSFVTFTTVADGDGRLYLAPMKFAEIEQEALALPERDRAALAAKLLGTLPPPGTDVSNEEVEKREQELESGQTAAISHEEFVRRVEEERGRCPSLE